MEQVTVTKVVPFGAPVERADGMAGLVVDVAARQGDNLRVQIATVNRNKQRFSATLV